MKIRQRGFLRVVRDFEYESQCPYCEHDNIKDKHRSDEGRQEVKCEVCGNYYYVIIDKEDIYRERD